MIRCKTQSVDKSLLPKACARLDSLTKPQGSLGRLEEFARDYVAMTCNEMPEVPQNKAIFTFAGDHGVVDEGVSLYPREVTVQMVRNFLSGGAAINVLSRHAGVDEIVVDIGVDHDFEDEPGLIVRKVMKGTKNMRRGPAMTRDEAEQCVQTGIDLAVEYADRGYDMFGTGEMGIGNTTPSSAIAAVMSEMGVRTVTDRGTGINNAALENKIKIIEEAIAFNKPDAQDAIDVLSKVGGTEIGGIAGLILGAASRRIPVVVDGFISTAGALIAYRIDSKVRDYMFAAHSSVERGQAIMLKMMNLRPILSLDLRLGEGTGAALAMLMIEAGIKIYREMATFEEAGVSTELK
jgi:nicotinate-nucleotide--dimethylbenzimidazole phosphoribosyltransferase